MPRLLSAPQTNMTSSDQPTAVLIPYHTHARCTSTEALHPHMPSRLSAVLLCAVLVSQQRFATSCLSLTVFAPFYCAGLSSRSYITADSCSYRCVFSVILEKEKFPNKWWQWWAYVESQLLCVCAPRTHTMPSRTERCAGANKKASPPGRQQRCTFRPNTFSSVQFIPSNISMVDSVTCLRSAECPRAPTA